MTSKLKCPFCGEEIKIAGERTTIMSCFNGECCGSGLYGEEAMWQALIQAKQDLEVATKALKEYANKDNWGCIEDDRDRFVHTYWYFDGCDDGGWVNADKALEQIEHKEK